MNHIENLTRYTANFIDELVSSGLEHVVVSPGSRSTALAILCAEHEQVKEWVIIDERSAAYFALGIAKKTNKPVALICTSGTAAANYFPAIIEAYYARVPLLILTADRPHELRHIGASQTINQLNMYGDFVKKFEEMALPAGDGKTLRYVRNRASTAVHLTMEGNPGPVHLNFPFREPLVPDLSLDNLWGANMEGRFNLTYDGKKSLSSDQIDKLVAKIATKSRGVIVCGPQVDESLAANIVALSEKLHAPILADPTSQLRAGNHALKNVIANYDAIFRVESLRESLKPDYIIRFGAMPISKSYLFYLQTHEAALQIVVENSEDIREPTNHPTDYIFADSNLLCEQLVEGINKSAADNDWLQSWQAKDRIAQNEITKTTAKKLTEGEVVTQVLQSIPESSDLFIANSMPVRDLDTYFMPTDKQITIHANRGVSGIDGVTSTALGIAAMTQVKLTLIIGDLSFYHDLNSLLIAKQYNLNITIVLINNDGGGIFSFLPQSQEAKHFESLFGTAHGLEFSQAIEMYGGKYELVNQVSELQQALKESYQTVGLSVIEIQTDREENLIAHRTLWENIEQELMKSDA